MDISPLLVRLRAVSNDELRAALRSERLEIENERFQIAFQCVAASYDLSRPETALGGPPGVPLKVVQSHRFRASIIFLLYSTLCYMRSKHLERGLDEVPQVSPLRPFRDIYRTGRMAHGEDTVVQHIRNSLAHGSFQLQIAPKIVFSDRAWREEFDVSQLKELCEHVHRLYHEAFGEEVQRPPHWSRFGLSAT